MGDHALLSPSSSIRWLNCTPSPRLEESIEDESSEYAKEGSFAHMLGELHLKHFLGHLTTQQFNKVLKEMKKNPYYSDEMESYIQTYVDYSIEKINEARSNTQDAVILLEQKLDYSNIVPSGYGTGDLVLITQNTLEILDLKYGRGLAVSAYDNPQMKLYAIGAINQFGILFEIETVRMTIMQPRLDSISTFEMTAEELLKWAEEDVRPKAELAFQGEGEFKAGDHCRWCKVKSHCRKRVEENMKIACMDFKKPPLLDDDEIVEVLRSIDELKKWAQDVEEYAFSKAVKEGKMWPGFKLVEGRSSRKFSSENEVIRALAAAGFKEDTIYSKSLLSLTAMEKALGKNTFNEVLGDLITRAPGKLKLVPDEDQRPEIKNTAQADFREE